MPPGDSPTIQEASMTTRKAFVAPVLTEELSLSSLTLQCAVSQQCVDN
jgi:hypothetical protein